MSAEDLEKYEAEMKLQLYREYRDVVGLFTHVVETERRFYLTNDVELNVRSSDNGEVFFEVTMRDAWVWDMYRPARFVKKVRVVTFEDVDVEELAKADLEVPEEQAGLPGVTNSGANGGQMLGLPDGVTACLFDMDGVVTQTAMRARGGLERDVRRIPRRKCQGDWNRVCAVRLASRIQRIRRRQAEARWHQVFPGVPRHPPARRNPGRSARHADRLRSEQPEERPGPGEDSLRRRAGVRRHIRYIKAVREAKIATAVVSASANTKQVLKAADIEDLFDVRIDGVVAKERGLRGKPTPDTFLAAAEALKVPPEHAVVFEDAQAGVAAGHAGHFALVVGVDRVGQAAELKEHGADIVVRTSGTPRDRNGTRRIRTPDDQAVGLRDRALAARGEAARPWPARSERVDLRAVERAYRAARQPRRGRPARAAGHLPELGVRGAAAAVRRGGLRLPRRRADRDQRHQRQDHPPARRR